MATVKVHVWHKKSGEIVAIGQPIGNAKCIPVNGEDHSALELEVEEGHIRLLHKTHMIDVKKNVAVEIPTKKC